MTFAPVTIPPHINSGRPEHCNNAFIVSKWQFPPSFTVVVPSTTVWFNPQGGTVLEVDPDCGELGTLVGYPLQFLDGV